MSIQDGRQKSKKAATKFSFLHFHIRRWWFPAHHRDRLLFIYFFFFFNFFFFNFNRYRLYLFYRTFIWANSGRNLYYYFLFTDMFVMKNKSKFGCFISICLFGHICGEIRHIFNRYYIVLFKFDVKFWATLELNFWQNLIFFLRSICQYVLEQY